ncbi:hypothetical protein M3G15_10575 [Paenibacillus sp. p3-SID1389]|uniref:hypothetical protein n=1 Tax=Paenibacillus sp. p3-SID1389 TaxID=2916364 RepID=UPI0021A41521|nr:hypothetical protein [Paenibacillus sp. p3-SID1389]MCT2195582.1 hypothetical protein [Paenibacillus sp. p3-SID1389]
MLYNRRDFWNFLGGLVFFSLFLFAILKLWKADFYIPFGYDGDYLSASSFIKSVVDFGWYINNPSLGAPFSLNMNDYPLGGDNFNFLIVKVLSLFTNDYAIVSNLFYLVSFYLTYLSAYLVLRKLKIQYSLSFIGSIMFAFMPYHFFRANGGHIFLSFYFMIPFAILVSFWIFSSNFNLLNYSNNDYKRKNIAVIFISILLGSTGTYYAFFAGLFWFLASIISFLKNKKANTLISGCLAVFLILISLIINLAPSIIFKLSNGPNNEASIRHSVESEIYGLKIDQILMPIQGHRWDVFSDISQKYAASAPLVNENHTVSLGIIGSLGFIILIAVLFYSPPKINNNISNMSLLNIASVLIATIGGFSYVFAAVITPSIRGYNRIIPFIGFMSIYTVIIIIQFLLNKIGKRKRIFSICMQVMILLFAVWDQTSPQFVPNYSSLKERYNIDKDFYNHIEKILDKGDSVFQLPYIPFPEHPTVNNMGNYDHLRAYLHTSQLRWSFGAMKGSKEDLVIREISNEPANRLLESIAYADFSGIMFNRDGYSDNKLEQEISGLLGISPIVSTDGKLAFYDIRDYKNILKIKGDWENKHNAVLHPVLTNFYDGFYDVEEDNYSSWRWSDKGGKIDFINTSDSPQKITFSGYISTSTEKKSTLVINSATFSEVIEINSVPLLYSKSIEVQPGETTITLESNAERLNAPNDPRNLYFRIDNFSLIVSE